MFKSCMMCGAEINDKRRCENCGTPRDAIKIQTKDFTIVLNDAYGFRNLVLSDVLNEIYRGMGEPFDFSKATKTEG